MKIRQAGEKDRQDILRIYACAHRTMTESGNRSQWMDDYPECVLDGDIEKKQIWVCEENGRICASFVLIIGPDPTYARIEQGAWLSDALYGTMHRIASDGTHHGIFPLCMSFCRSQISHMRVDTHEKNQIMRKQIERFGFSQRGIIYVADGTPRVAYEIL